jgi:hypothetical protein
MFISRATWPRTRDCGYVGCSWLSAARRCLLSVSRRKAVLVGIVDRGAHEHGAQARGGYTVKSLNLSGCIEQVEHLHQRAAHAIWCQGNYLGVYQLQGRAPEVKRCSLMLLGGSANGLGKMGLVDVVVVSEGHAVR